MRVIITGGAGQLGRGLADGLLADQHEVILLSRTPEKAKNVPAGAKVEKWDGKSAAGWGNLVDGAGAVINLAGHNIGGTGFLPTRWTPKLKQQFIDSRVNAGQAVVEAIEAAKQKPEVLVQSSAIGYYGVHGDEILDEASTVGSDFMSTIVIAWENATQPVEKLGVRRVVVRTGLVFNAHEGILTRLIFPFKLFVGGPLGSGRQYMSWIHVADEIGAMRFLMDQKTASGVHNLTAPNPLPNREVAKIIGRVMGRPSFMPAPEFVFKLAFGEVATIIVDGQRVLPRRLLDAGYKFRFPELEPALRDLIK